MLIKGNVSFDFFTNLVTTLTVLGIILVDLMKN